MTSTPAPLLHLPLRGSLAELEAAVTDVTMIADPDYGPVASFNGLTSQIIFDGLTCPRICTIMLWVKHRDLTGVFALLEYGDNRPLLTLIAGRPVFVGHKPGPDPEATSAVMSAPIPEAWTHVAVTVDAAFASIYLNGEFVRKGPAVDEGGVGLALGTPRGERPFPGSQRRFIGELAEVQVFDQALSLAAIRQLMTDTSPAAAAAATAAAAAAATPAAPATLAAPPAAEPAPATPEQPPAAAPQIPAVVSAEPVYVHNLVLPEFTRLDLPAQAFYETYGDDYDFLIFVTPPIKGLNPLYSPVRRDICPGLGHTYESKIAPVRNGAAYGSPARLKGAIWVPLLGDEYSPPTSNHEILHYWGTYLLSQWPGFITNMGGHWGYASTDGSHGGFNVDSLRDAADQPITDPLSVQPGSIVRLADFSTGASSISTPYSPIELYLMGLVDKAEIPQDIFVMKNPQYVTTEAAPKNADPYDETVVPPTVVYKVDGFTRIRLDELLALNPGGPPRATQKAFRAAFILVTDKPASEAVLRKVEGYAKLAGHIIEDRPTIPQRMAEWEAKQRAAGTWIEGSVANPRAFPPRARYLSFEEATGGRATLDTRLTPKSTT